MKKFFEKNDEGFTLVELMVVVAIIGILSAIAVPNFKKYQAKSKQSEAKIQLAAVYSTEIGASADYDSYGVCLLQLGYEQSPRGYYRIGFHANFDASAKITGCTGGAAAAVEADVGAAALPADFSMSPLKHLSATAVHPDTIADPLAVATGLAFVAGAEGVISGSAANHDQWTINNTKALSNSAAGF